MRWFCISLFSCLLFLFGLSKINFINEVAFEKNILQKNILYQHNVHVVSSEVATKRQHRYLQLDIVVPNGNNSQTLIFQGEKINEKELEDRIIKSWYQFSEAEIPFINHTLSVDKNVKMKRIFNLKTRMNKIGVKKVSYAAKKHNTKKPFYFKSDYALNFYLPSNLIDNKKDKFNEVSVIIGKDQNYLFNSKTITNSYLTKSIKKHFKIHGTKPIRIFINENTLFSEYFQVLESSKKAVDELRNEYSQKGYAVDFLSLNREQRSFIRNRIRWYVIDDIK